jgi:hypothetical protein
MRAIGLKLSIAILGLMGLGPAAAGDSHFRPHRLVIWRDVAFGMTPVEVHSLQPAARMPLEPKSAAGAQELLALDERSQRPSTQVGFYFLSSPVDAEAHLAFVRVEQRGSDVTTFHSLQVIARLTKICGAPRESWDGLSPKYGPTATVSERIWECGTAAVLMVAVPAVKQIETSSSPNVHALYLTFDPNLFNGRSSSLLGPPR